MTTPRICVTLLLVSHLLGCPSSPATPAAPQVTEAPPPAESPTPAQTSAPQEDPPMPTDTLELKLIPECAAMTSGKPCPIKIRFANGTAEPVPLHRAGFVAGYDLRLFVSLSGQEPFPVGTVGGLEPSTDEADMAPLAPGASLTTTADLSPMMMGLLMGSGDTLGSSFLNCP